MRSGERGGLGNVGVRSEMGPPSFVVLAEGTQVRRLLLVESRIARKRSAVGDSVGTAKDKSQ